MMIRRVPRAISGWSGTVSGAGRMPEVDMTSFLVIHDISQFAQCPDNIPAGKDGEFVRHMSTATNISFCTRPLIQGNAIPGECAEMQFDGFGNVFLRICLSLS